MAWTRSRLLGQLASPNCARDKFTATKSRRRNSACRAPRWTISPAETPLAMPRSSATYWPGKSLPGAMSHYSTQPPRWSLPGELIICTMRFQWRQRRLIRERRWRNCRRSLLLHRGINRVDVDLGRRGAWVLPFAPGDKLSIDDMSSADKSLTPEVSVPARERETHYLSGPSRERCRR